MDKTLGEAGATAASKESKQLDDMDVITPIHPWDVTKREVTEAILCLMLLERKQCGKIKA